MPRKKLKILILILSIYIYCNISNTATAQDFNAAQVKKCVIDQFTRYKDNNNNAQLYLAKHAKVKVKHKKEIIKIYSAILDNQKNAAVRGIKIVLKKNIGAFAKTPYPASWEAETYNYGYSNLMKDKKYNKFATTQRELYSELGNKKFFYPHDETSNFAMEFLRQVIKNSTDIKIMYSGINIGACYPTKMMDPSLLSGLIAVRTNEILKKQGLLKDKNEPKVKTEKKKRNPYKRKIEKKKIEPVAKVEQIEENIEVKKEEKRTPRYLNRKNKDDSDEDENKTKRR